MGKSYGNGINQGDLADLVLDIKTKHNAVNAKLDADTGVAGEDYASLHNVAIPAGIQTTKQKAIRSQGDVLTFLQDVITQFNARNAKLDAETLGDSDYAATCNITDTIGAGTDRLRSNGVEQGALVNLLNAVITKHNALLAKLDADGTVVDTDYASLQAITDTVVEAGTRA